MSRIPVSRSQADPFFRYRMDAVIVRVQGRAKYSCIPNLHRVAADLKADAAVLAKFIGYELGSSFRVDKKTREISFPAKLDAATVQEIIYKFIDLFVLCPVCQLPDTHLALKGETSPLHIICEACGIVRPIPDRKTPGLRVSALLIRQLQQQLQHKSEAVAKVDKAAPSSSSPSSSSDSEHDDAAAACGVDEASDTESDDEVSAVTVCEGEALAAAVTQLKSVLAASPASATPFVLAEHVRRAQITGALAVEDRVKLYFLATMDHRIIAQSTDARTKGCLLAILAQVATDEAALARSRAALLTSLQHHVTVTLPALLPALVVVLKNWYDCDVLDEDSILVWYDALPPSSDAVKTVVAPLADWLRADSDSDSSSDDE